MGRDRKGLRRNELRLNFNPLSPHGERPRSSWERRRTSDFNPLSPHGERRPENARRRRPGRFQSTLPAWGETFSRPTSRSVRRFQSTLPAWGETTFDVSEAFALFISIHSPRMGRDPDPRPSALGGCHFNPLSPHGERRNAHMTVLTPKKFQSTLPAWGETGSALEYGLILNISIHSPRMGRDLSTAVLGLDAGDFNPLSPHGERLLRYLTYLRSNKGFQSTLPAWGETANAHNFSKRKTGASAQHCIFSPATRFFLLTKDFLEKRNKPFFRCEPYRKNVEAPVSHQPLKN